MIGRRAVRVVAVLHVLAALAVCAAPRASASSNAVVLNWTGLKDTYGVPIGDYYLSLASTTEAIADGGPDVSWNPASWMAWTVHAFAVMGTHWTVAWVLTFEAGLFVGIVAIALVTLRITVSSYWLTVIGDIARAISGAVIQVTTELGLVLIAIPVGVFTGVVTVRRGEAGRGATMILIALTMPGLSVAVFADPAGEMYGPNGLLAFGRRIGFSVAEAATRNGPVDGAVGAGGQVDSLTASLITHTVREPLQLWNFGHVVDRVGGCGTAWSVALLHGAPDGPLHAMATCGDRAALAYGQQLDGTNAWIGLVFVFAAAALGLFVVVSGWAVLRVSVQAVWTTVILLPALWVGSIPGAPQRRAVQVVWEFFRHGLEVTAYIVYVGVIGLAIERLVSRPLPAQLGGVNPFAHVLIMAAASLAALFLLRHVKAELAGRPGGRGVLGRAGDVAIGMGINAAVGAGGRAGLEGVGRARGWLRSRTDPPPWEPLDRAAENARRIHGEPKPGWDPILQSSLYGGMQGTGGPAADGRAGSGEGPTGEGAAGAATPLTVGRLLDRHRSPESRTARRGSPGGSDRDTPDRGVPHSGLPAPTVTAVAAADGEQPRAVPAVAEPGRGAESSDVNEVSGPPEEDGPRPDPPTTVEPITDTEPGDAPQR